VRSPSLSALSHSVGLVDVLAFKEPSQAAESKMPSHMKQPDQTRIIAFLAEELDMPIDDVSNLYEHERAELALGAHITKFIHIFAIRNVQQILRTRGLDERSLTVGSSALPAI
jgi:hypothetical protein